MSIVPRYGALLFVGGVEPGDLMKANDSVSKVLGGPTVRVDLDGGGCAFAFHLKASARPRRFARIAPGCYAIDLGLWAGANVFEQVVRPTLELLARVVEDLDARVAIPRGVRVGAN